MLDDQIVRLFNGKKSQRRKKDTNDNGHGKSISNDNGRIKRDEEMRFNSTTTGDRDTIVNNYGRIKGNETRMRLVAHKGAAFFRTPPG